MKGKIEQARDSQSGKTIGVKVNGEWFQSKDFELKNCVGQMIEFEPTYSTWQDKRIGWLKDYWMATDAAMPDSTPPPVAASTARESNAGRPDDNDNFVMGSLLLRFIGNALAGTAASPTDEVQLRNKCRMLYNIGKDILSGDIQKVETTPRHRQAVSKPEDERQMAAENEQQSQQGLDMDDIPF